MTELINSFSEIRIGEFLVRQYTDDSLLITKDEEAMEVNLDTLKKFWDENI